MDIEHFPRLRARARRLTRNPQDAEDLCHEVCLAYLERKSEGAKIEKPLPYMMTALRHAAHARAVRMSKEQPFEEDQSPKVEDASLACLCSEVLRHLEHLPKPDRTLLCRIAMDGVTPSELALELEIPVGTVMSRLARARARLLKDLGLNKLF